MSYIGQTLHTKRFNSWLFLFLKFNEVSQGSLDVYQVSWHDPKTRIYLFYGWGFQLFSRYLDISCSGGVKQTLWTLTYIPLTQGTKIYMISRWVYQLFSRFLGILCSLGVKPISGAHEQHIIWCLLHKEQDYLWFRDGNLNYFQDIWALPVRRGQNHPRAHELHTI